MNASQRDRSECVQNEMYKKNTHQVSHTNRMKRTNEPTNEREQYTG